MSDPALWLARMRVDPVALRLFAERAGVADDDLGYAMHLALRRRYGVAAPQPFRWPAPVPNGAYVLLGYSPDASALHRCDPRAQQSGHLDELALPHWSDAWSADDTLAAIFPEPVETKRMPDGWKRGRRLAFSLRVRPVVRYGKAVRSARADEARRDAGERDVFLAAVERRDRAGATQEKSNLSRDDVYGEWLRGQLAPAAVVDSARLIARRRSSVVRRRHAEGRTKRIEGPEAEFDGILRIDDTPAFARLLCRGVGRHAAFGFGMLLLRPVGG